MIDTARLSSLPTVLVISGTDGAKEKEEMGPRTRGQEGQGGGEGGGCREGGGKGREGREEEL